MKFLKISAFALVLVGTLAATSLAQSFPGDCINDFLNCDSVSESSVDYVKLRNIAGRPDDTVWLPVAFKSRDTTSGFLILVEYNSAKVQPWHLSTDEVTLLSDTLLMHYQLAGPLLAAQNGVSGSGEIFTAQISVQSVDVDDGADVIICAFNLGISGDSTNSPPRLNPTGTSEQLIFQLPFIVNMPDGDTSLFSFRQVNETVLLDPSTLDLYCADCRRTNMSVDRDCVAELYDPQGDSTYIDTVTCTSVLYPSLDDGVLTADATPPPAIAGFSVTPDSLGTGDPFVVAWSVSNADSVFITGQNVDIATNVLDDDQIAYAPSTEGTYTYTLTTQNQFDTISATTSLKVQNGTQPPPDEHQPQINVATVQYTEVGNTLVFTVSATDPDGDFITLEATSLPANATFPTVTGNGSASGSFTFTPTISQAGAQSATFRCSDGNTTPVTATVQINVAEPQYDKLYTASTERSASGGIKGKPHFLFPVNLVTSQTVYGVQFDFIYDEQNFNVNNVLNTINTPEYSTYHNIGDVPGMVRVITFGLANEPIGNDGTEILYIDMGAEVDALPGQYPVRFDNAWESVNPDPEFPSLPLIADTGVVQVDLLGDVNLNLNVDVADLVSVVGYIIEAYGFNERRMDVGDVNFDGNVNVFDLVAIINIILTGQQPASPGLQYEDQFAKVQLDFNDLYSGGDEMIVVNSELPTDLAGVELEITYDPNSVFLGKPELGADASMMTINSSNNGGGKLKVLLHSGNLGSGGTIGFGQAELARIPVTTNEYVPAGDTSEIKLTKALLSTSVASAVRVEGLDEPLPTSFRVAQNYPNPFNPNTTIEFTFGPLGQHVRLDVFNILGQNVTTLLDEFLSPGNHQVQWNSTDHDGHKVASGVYLYRLQVGEESQTKKMLLLK